MPTPRAMFRILSVTCLLTRKALVNYYSRLAHVLHVERFCMRIRCIIPIDNFSASNNLYCYRHCGCPACVCVSVRSFLPPRASISRNIGTYVFTATRKTLYIGIIIVIFAEMLRSEATAGVICLPRMPLTAPELQNTDTNGIHADSAFFVRISSI